MKKLIVIIITLVYMIQNFTSSIDSVYSEEIKNEKIDVLFISSFDYNFISFEDQVQGIRKGFNNNLNLRVEYMDLKVFDSKENEEAFYQLINHAINNYNIDIIIAGDDEATEFCIKYRDSLFKGLPISFLGVQELDRSNRAVELDLVSGITEIESIEDNINLIKKFHPKVDTITFIDTYGEKKYEDITSKYKDINFEWITTDGLTVEETKNRLLDLDKNDAIIELYVHKFKDESTLNRGEVNKLISQNAINIPIYNILSYDIENGSIGGKVVNHIKQGEGAAKVSLSLLNNEDEKSLYIDDDSLNDYIFDHNALKKFGIREGELPKGSIVINNPKDIFKDYKGVIVGFIMLMLGLVGCVITLLWYIYYRKKYEKATQKAINNAEEANRIKAHFISNISHELKTPINVIVSAVQLLKYKSIKGDLCSGQINNLNIINDNCNRLLRLINNIIDVQKSELDEITLNKKSVNIVELIESIVTSVVPYAKAKKLDLIFDTTEEYVIADVDINKIERIILNLLSNAIKFSNENSEIRVNLAFAEYIYIIIEDDGIGINKDSIDNIFDKFIQIDNSFCRKNEGSGIGLSIVKSFVELHGGCISVKSKPNEGSKFTVIIPRSNSKNRECESISTDRQIENIKMELSDIYI
ncbi:MAG: ABC transporter substrate binding protein [Peptostreptococcaceae bacterium]